MEEFYRPVSNKSSHPYSCVYAGRLDKSKDIETIIRTVHNVRKTGYPLTLTVIGRETRSESFSYMSGVRTAWKDAIEDGWLIFTGSVERSRLRDEFSKHSFFIHAYKGSMDKVLIESAIAALPVITLNEEFNSNFAVELYNEEATLSMRVISFLALTDRDKQLFAAKLQRHALKHHSLTSWINRLMQVLMGER